VDGSHVIRSYRTPTTKLIMTSLRLRPGVVDPSQQRSTLVGLGERLAGSPVLALNGERLLAFEMFDLEADPQETENLLGSLSDWTEAVRSATWAQPTVPSSENEDRGEIEVASILNGAELL
jgi:hypothetical protein